MFRKIVADAFRDAPGHHIECDEIHRIVHIDDIPLHGHVYTAGRHDETRPAGIVRVAVVDNMHAPVLFIHENTVAVHINLAGVRHAAFSIEIFHGTLQFRPRHIDGYIIFRPFRPIGGIPLGEEEYDRTGQANGRQSHSFHHKHSFKLQEQAISASPSYFKDTSASRFVAQD